MRRDYLDFMRHSQLFQLRSGVLHRFPVRLAAHNDADERSFGGFGCHIRGDVYTGLTCGVEHPFRDAGRDRCQLP